MRSLLFYEFKRLFRDRINQIFVVLIFAVTGLGLWFESITAFQGYRYLHQLVVWWAVFSGYRFAASQRRVGVEEWIRSLPQENKRVAAQIGALYLQFALCVAGMALMATVIFFFSSLAVHVLWQTYWALVLYYLLSMAIAGSAGWMLGRAVPQMVGYLLAAVLGYGMGSLGAVWMYALFESMPAWQAVSPTFGFAPGSYYTALAGYDLSTVQWTKHLLWFCMALFLVNLFFGRAKRKKEIGAVFLLSGLLLGAVGIQEQTGAVRHVLVKDYSLVKADMEPYYEVDKENPLQASNFRWVTMNLSIGSSVEGLRVTGEGVAEFLRDDSELAFTLQRKFEPDSWSIDGVERTGERVGDVLRFSLDEPKKNGETVEVRFAYGGIPYAEFTANASMVVLPNFFQWIPQPNTSQPILFRDGSIITVPHRDEAPVNVTLHWEGESPYWTNATGGLVSDGIAFIAGYINQVERDGITYVYTDADPVAAERNSWPILAAMREAAEELDIFMPDIHTIVALQSNEMRLEFLAGTGAVSRLAGDTMYLTGGGFEYPPFQEGDPDRSLERFRYNVIIGLLLDQPEFLYQDEDMQRAFVHAYVYPYTTYVTKYIPYPDLIKFLSEEEDIKGFLRTWYGEMRDNTEYTRKDLQTLMKEWKGGLAPNEDLG